MRIIYIVCLVLMLSSCSTDINDYQGTNPKFDIKQYFSGQLTAWGVVQDYQGQITRRFCVEIEGTWDDNKGVLDEVFYFDDGEITTRVWQLEKLTDGRYQGTAGDVIGMAQGREVGFAFYWRYQLKVPVDGETYHLWLDDWMYQLDQDRVLNKTQMQKLGITVADITLFFDKNVKQCSNRVAS